MINNSVLRIISAKGAGDGLLRKIHKDIENGLQYSLEEICESKTLMKFLGISDDVARNIYDAKDMSIRLQDELYNSNVEMCWLGDGDYPQGLREVKVGFVFKQ